MADRPEPAVPDRLAVANPAVGADAEQHVREEIARIEASAVRRARHLVRWLAVSAGALAGWLFIGGRSRR